MVLSPAVRSALEKRDPESEGEGSLPIQTIELGADGSASLRLPAGSLWKVRAVADGWWGSEEFLWVPEVPDGKAAEDGFESSKSEGASSENGPIKLRLPLFRTTDVEGQCLVAKDHQLPRNLELSFAPTPIGKVLDQRRLEPVAEGSVTCPLEDSGAFRCAIPETSSDLVMRAEGFAPLYLWDQEIGPDRPLDLGNLRLTVGASVSGSVVVDAPETSHPISIEIAPAHAGTPAFETARRLESRALHTEPDSRGFFQLKQVPEGTYKLKASAKGLGETVFGPFTVYAGRETILPEPLVLSPPLTLEVAVHPPTHPRHGAWNGVFVPEPGPENRSGSLIRDDFAEDGLWLATGLRPGSYHLKIEDRFGNPWYDEVVDVGPWTTHLEAEIPVVEVEGRVTLDGQPVRARLRLRRLGVNGDLEDQRMVSLYSDSEGRVEGYLPESGTWKISALLRPRGAWCDQGQIEIPASQDGKPVEVDFVLHDQGLRGVVWSPTGEPAEGARVIAHRLTDGLPRGSSSTAETDREGRFDFLSLPAGRYSVYALGTGTPQAGTSSRKTVEITAGESRSVELRLEPLRDLEVQVVSERGPVVGAAVRAEPKMTDPYRPEGPVERSTDVTGTAKLRVPVSAESLTILVLAPGYGARLLEVSPPQRNDPLVIGVDDAAGILALDLPPDQRTRRLLARLHHGSASENLFPLSQWATIDPATGHWLLEMEMGDWWLCPGERRDDRCDGGFLGPGGILELSLEQD